MNWYLVKLKFSNLLHIGDDEAGIGVENVQSIIHSDTIFSALVNVASLMDKDFVVFLLKGNFHISSAFPYDEKHYYLPRPLSPLPMSFGRYAKEVKKSEFLQEGDFRAWIGNQLNEGNITGVISRSQDAERISTGEVRPRNASDRQTSITVLYHCGGTTFEENSGLYFILETDNDGKGKFQKILMSLKKFGFGGERSSGYGQFDFEITGPVDFEEGVWRDIKNADGNCFCILSLWYPKKEEQIDIKAYQTVLRKGWIFSTSSQKQMKRETFRMFKEGSVFGNQLEGELVDVTPNKGFDDHKVYRWGKAFSVKMNVSA